MASTSSEAATCSPPLVVELSHGIVRYGTAPCEKREDMTYVSVIDVGKDKASVGEDRKLRELKSHAPDLAQIWDDIAEARRAYEGTYSGLVLIVPSATSKRSMRAIARHGLLAIDDAPSSLSIIPACSAHCVGAGIASGVMIDAGRYGTDVAFTQDTMGIEVDSLTRISLRGIDAERAVEGMLLAEFGDDFVRPEDAGRVIGHFATLGAGVELHGPPTLPETPSAGATDSEAAESQTASSMPTLPIPPAQDMTLRGKVLTTKEWADRVSGAVHAVVASQLPALAEAVKLALDYLPSLTEDEIVVNVSGGLGTLPGFNRLLTAHMDSVVMGLGSHIVISSKAFGACNAFNAGCFFGARSNWAKQLAITADECRRNPTNLVYKTGGTPRGKAGAE